MAKALVDDIEFAKIIVNAMFAGAALTGLISRDVRGLETGPERAWEVADKMTAEFIKRVAEAEAKQEKEKKDLENLREPFVP